MRYLIIFIFVSLLSGCAATKGHVYGGMSKIAYCQAINLTGFETACNKKGSYFYKNGIEVLRKGNTYAIFNDVTIPNQSDFWTFSPGNGIFVAEVRGWDQAQEIINKLDKTAVKSQYDQYIERCEYLGFKRNTEKMGECALKFYQTEKQIALLSVQERQANSQNLLNNLLILDKSLQLLSPPRVQNRNLNCFYNQVGGRGFVNCR